MPIAIPAGVTVKLGEENLVTVKGPKGELTKKLHPLMTITEEAGVLHVTRPNEEKETPYDGFAYEAIVPINEEITLESPEDLQNLFQMTPYYWKTPKTGAKRLADLESLTTRISFRIHIFQKL